MIDINTILIALGALLLLVGIIGGGFEIKEIKIPKVSMVPRITALLIGLILVGKIVFFPTDRIKDLSISETKDYRTNISKFDTNKMLENVRQKQQSGEEIGKVDCKLESHLKSVSSDTSTYIYFKNEANYLVSIYWIDFEGNRKYYNSLKPTQGYKQQTYISHPWIVTGAKGNCLGIYFPKKEMVDIAITN